MRETPAQPNPATGRTHRPPKPAAPDGGPSPRIPFYIAGGAFLAFWPALWNGFVWDDAAALIDNYRFRGFGAQNLRWMFSTVHLGHYEPITWLSLAADYLLHGMEPRGYHATNILLHAANAALFYLIALRLLGSVFSEEFSARRKAPAAGAAFAALAFAVHPLRVESVAWVTERRDVLSGLFFMSAILFYLRSAQVSSAGRPWNRALWASVACYLLSLMSKASATTLPLVLVVLDAYPLRRLGTPPESPWAARAWSAPETRSVWLEKVPFLIPALAFGTIAPLAQRGSGALEPLASYGLGPRLGQAAFGAAFYLWKTLFPLRLLPLYRFPEHFSPFVNHAILWSVLAVAGLSAAAFRLRNRWPAGLALWLCYLALLAPVLGFFQSGPQFAADRYTYLSCLGWAVLAGAGVSSLVRRSEAGGSPWGGTAAVLMLYLAVLGLLTWRQIGVWRDGVSLWSYDAAADPSSALAHNNLCGALRDEGRAEDALAHCREALRLKPGYENALDNLGGILAAQGKLDEAIQAYRAALGAGASDPSVRFGLAHVLQKSGALAPAIREYEAALRLRPEYRAVYDDLGSALKEAGRYDEAATRYREALALEPADATAHNGLGAVQYQLNRIDDAVREYREALRISPDDAQTHSNLGAALDAQGKLDDSLREYEAALRSKPNYAAAYNNRGIVLFKKGRFDEALRDFQRALELDPSYADARANLARAVELRGKIRLPSPK